MTEDLEPYPPWVTRSRRLAALPQEAPPPFLAGLVLSSVPPARSSSAVSLESPSASVGP